MYDDTLFPECRTIVIQNDSLPLTSLDNGSNIACDDSNVLQDIAIEEVVYTTTNTDTMLDRRPLRTYQRRGKTSYSTKIDPPVIKVKAVQAVKLPVSVNSASAKSVLKRLSTPNSIVTRKSGILVDKSKLKSNINNNDEVRIATTRFTRSNVSNLGNSKVPVSDSRCIVKRNSNGDASCNPLRTTTIITKTFTQNNKTGVVQLTQKNKSPIKHNISGTKDVIVSESFSQHISPSKPSFKPMNNSEQFRVPIASLSPTWSEANSNLPQPDCKSPNKAKLVPLSSPPANKVTSTHSNLNSRLLKNSFTSQSTHSSSGAIDDIDDPAPISPPTSQCTANQQFEHQKNNSSEEQIHKSASVFNNSLPGATELRDRITNTRPPLNVVNPPPLNNSSRQPTNNKDNKRAPAQGDDLTSLSWLHSLDMVGMVPHMSTPPTPPASPPLYGYNDPKRKQKEPPEEPVRQEPPIDYSKDGSKKPPYSYAALIGMAMKENGNKMTLSAIYKWIKEHYIFYKTADPSWQVRELMSIMYFTRLLTPRGR